MIRTGTLEWCKMQLQIAIENKNPFNIGVFTDLIQIKKGESNEKTTTPGN